MRIAAVAALSVLFSGCAGTTQGVQSGFDPDVLTQEEILEVPIANLWEVVNRLRPQWLRVISNPTFSGGNASIVVYRDNVRLGGPDALRSLNPEVAKELRYLDAREAAARFSGAMSSGQIAGAILVITRSP